MFDELFDGDVHARTQTYDFQDHEGKTMHVIVKCVPGENQHVERWVPHVVWAAAEDACRAIASTKRDLVAGKSVLELGSGTGLCGLLAGAVSGTGNCVLTDGSEEAVEFLRESVGLNPAGWVKDCAVLRWGDAAQSAAFKEKYGTFDVIIGTDVVYDPVFIAPLLETSAALLAPGGTLWLANHRFRFRQFADSVKEKSGKLPLALVEQSLIGADVDVCVFKRNAD